MGTYLSLLFKTLELQCFSTYWYILNRKYIILLSDSLVISNLLRRNIMKKAMPFVAIIVLTLLLTSCSSKEISVLKHQSNELEKHLKESTLRIKQLEEAIKQKEIEIGSLRNDLLSKTTAMLEAQKELEALRAFKNEADKRDITFEDQKQVEQLITDYFKLLESKNYSTAWELLSPEQKKTYSKEDAIKSHWGIEAVKFISIKGYLPPGRIVKDGAEIWTPMSEVPPNTPTVSFMVTFDMKASADTAWNDGQQTRFVNAVKDSSGKWKIDGMATGP